jgi:L-lactate utilization protein LutC
VKVTSISRSEAALKAAATRKANKQAKQDRHDARIAAYHSLPESIRERLDEAISEIASDYSTTIDAVAQEAYETATDALNELAEKYGRQLVMAAAEGEYLWHDPVHDYLNEMIYWDEDDDIESLPFEVAELTSPPPDVESLPPVQGAVPLDTNEENDAA